MKVKINKLIPWIILCVLFIVLIPALSTRITNENNNKNITVALLYNTLEERLSEESLPATLENYKKIGVNTVAVMEEDLNALVSKGEITSIKYNVLLHKYDDESIYIGRAIKEAYPEVTLDSHTVIVKHEDEKAWNKLRTQLPLRYTEGVEYVYIDDETKEKHGVSNMDIYVFPDSHKNLWDFAVGFDEDDIKFLKDAGFNVSLIYKVKNYSKTDHLAVMERIIKDYDVEYLNLKATNEKDSKDKPDNKENYEKVARIINENNLTLVVTENEDQLSNQKFFGYSQIFNAVMSDTGSKKVIRSYETYDDSQMDSSYYGHRLSQHFNSTIDRNIRFVVVTQIYEEKTPYGDLADYTFKATEEYVKRVKDEGFTVNQETKPFDYPTNKTLTYAVCASLMVLALLIMLQLVFGYSAKRTFIFVILAVLSFGATLILPVSLQSLLSLYPTVYSVVMSCFAITAVLGFIKAFKEKFGLITLTLSSLIIAVMSLLIGSIGMGAMLSGVDYYINNDIFRGIKLSLLVPMFYTAVLFYLLFIKTKGSKFISDVYRLLNANIKVYWVLIGGVVLIIAGYYIIRSGNVSEINPIEAKMRSTMTELFAARPRTKEFLVGYPALILLVYYMKKTDIKLIQWLLAIGASILTASVTNSFCHVFTDYSIIVSRTINGLIVGLIIAAFAIIGNLILVKAAKAIMKKLPTDTEMK